MTPRGASARPALGALDGGLLGLVAGQVMVTEPSTASVLLLGAVGGGGLWGLFIGGVPSVIAPPPPCRQRASAVEIREGGRPARTLLDRRP